MDFDILYAYGHENEIRDLFSEYTDMLIENDSSFGEYLKIQKYDDEIKNLEEKYGMPYGRLYIAFCDKEPAGCIALRKMDNENCEMKRLYVKEKYRKHGLGRKLIEKIIADAKETGYKYMLLDTLPFLEEAIKIYKTYGFYEISVYNDSPMKNAVYLKLNL